MNVHDLRSFADRAWRNSMLMKMLDVFAWLVIKGIQITFILVAIFAIKMLIGVLGV